MVNRNCPALNETTEIKKKNVGNTSNGPIIVETEEIVDQYCQIRKTNVFDCNKCNYFR